MESRLELASGNLAYWDFGQGRPLVFIHGIGTNGAVWKDDLAPLASTYRVVVYDRRGYGSSSPSPGTWSGQVSDAEALISELRLEKPIVVGYSGGASIALALVVSRPDLVGSLVLLDPACNLKKCLTPEFIAAQIKVRLLRKLRGEQAGIRAWMRYVSSYPAGGCAFDKAPEARRQAVLANAHGLFADVDTPNGFSVDESKMGAIAVPTTIIDAKLSPPFLRKSTARLRRAIPHARNVTIERAGHHISIDARDELLDLLRATS
jgi:pimeloyl-ACP methyl ester carboxylesterase